MLNRIYEAWSVQWTRVKRTLGIKDRYRELGHVCTCRVCKHWFCRHINHQTVSLPWQCCPCRRVVWGLQGGVYGYLAGDGKECLLLCRDDVCLSSLQGIISWVTCFNENLRFHQSQNSRLFRRQMSSISSMSRDGHVVTVTCVWHCHVVALRSRHGCIMAALSSRLVCVAIQWQDRASSQLVSIYRWWMSAQTNLRQIDQRINKHPKLFVACHIL